jgi:inner membrane protein
MKWVSHKVITGTIIYAFTGDIFATIASMAGSTIPDAIEGRPDNTPLWHKYHRGLSHWFIPYLVFALIFIVIAKANGMAGITAKNFIPFVMHHTSIVIVYFAGFFLLGGSLHTFEDYFCGNIPSFNPKKRIGRKLFRVGSQKEYAITLSAIILLITMFLLKR